MTFISLPRYGRICTCKHTAIFSSITWSEHVVKIIQLCILLVSCLEKYRRPKTETAKLQGRKYSKILVFWGVTLCSGVNRLYHPAGPWCLLQGCGVPAEDVHTSETKPSWTFEMFGSVNPLSPELNPICYLLALLGAHHFLHISRIRVKLLTFRRMMSYIYEAPILDVSRSHTTTQHSR